MLTTRSVFYYGHTIDTLNFYLNFNEGAGELTAQLDQGEYTLSEFADEIARAMTEVGGQTYSVAVDRVTRKLTISASSNFSLLVSSGSNSGASVFSLAGFTGSDRTSSNSYEGDAGSGSEYLPQFWLQSYISSSDIKEAASAAVTQSASGIPQVVSFGTINFMECNIKFATDLNQGVGNPIETNLSGVSDLRDFMNNITNKTRIEFMPNRDVRTTYENFILESTPDNSDGINFTLKELYGQKMPFYYETGVLRFRKVV